MSQFAQLISNAFLPGTLKSRTNMERNGERLKRRRERKRERERERFSSGSLQPSPKSISNEMKESRTRWTRREKERERGEQDKDKNDEEDEEDEEDEGRKRRKMVEESSRRARGLAIFQWDLLEHHSKALRPTWPRAGSSPSTLPLPSSSIFLDNFSFRVLTRPIERDGREGMVHVEEGSTS